MADYAIAADACSLSSGYSTLNLPLLAVEVTSQGIGQRCGKSQWTMTKKASILHIVLQYSFRERNMKFLQIIALTVLAMITFSSAAIAKDDDLTGMRIGFAFDRGLGVIGSLKQLNIFIGNDGAAVDYLFRKDTLKTDLKGPVFWYVGGGGYADWNSDRGIRLPVGAEWHFVNELDSFAQIIPRLRFNIRYQFSQ